MNAHCVDSKTFSLLLHGGAENLFRHEAEVNDLNVFPIPDGDTGSNMLLTVRGGAQTAVKEGESVGKTARRIADGMLLSARGNSGVILSQFFDGIAAGLNGCEQADGTALGEAFSQGVKHAYAAVMEPTEGTILTVAREASAYAYAQNKKEPAGFFDDFLFQARKTLLCTPDMLPVLKKAGVVDSGGAGLIYIVEGMANALRGDMPADEHISPSAEQSSSQPDLDSFDENSVLTYGYCTELLLRLQNAKVDVAGFDETVIKDYLQSIGDSIVCFKNGSIVKMHVHTKQPYKVLEFCQQFGEFLTVKIENMSLQHNSLPEDSLLKREDKSNEIRERKKFGVVAVACGEGVKKTFLEMGADGIVVGGQSMNPSSDDFLKCFKAVNADTIYVLPNNSNVILAARQAASLCTSSDVRVIPSKTIGDGYAVLSMLDFDSGDADAIERDMTFAMQGVITAVVSRCCRDAEMDGFSLQDGQYIGFTGKELLSADNDRRDTACMLSDRLDFTGHEICIVIFGKDASEAEANEISSHISKAHPGVETYVLNGGQDVYSYILIVE